MTPPVPVPIVVVGGGRMGEAVVSGLVGEGVVDPGDVVVAEPLGDRRAALEEAYGVRSAADGAEALEGAGLVLLAVKPQVIDHVVRGLAPARASRAPGSLVVSIAAGVTCARLEAGFGDGVAVVRVMPNTPAMVGEGVSVVSGGTHADGADVDAVVELFGTLGRTVVVDERYQDVCTALSGSGPAYVAMFVEALADAAAAHGLDRAVAESLAVQTLRGTAALLERSELSPRALVDAVSSPGGTTVAATGALDAGGFRETVAAAVDAAVARAKELGS